MTIVKDIFLLCTDQEGGRLNSRIVLLSRKILFYISICKERGLSIGSTGVTVSTEPVGFCLWKQLGLFVSAERDLLSRRLI